MGKNTKISWANHTFNMDLEWARHSIRQCRQFNIVPFVKQLGGYPDARKDMTTWPEDLRVQEFPNGP